MESDDYICTEETVRSLYRIAFDREPDPIGLKFWRGQSLSTAIQGLHASQEFGDRCIAARRPDQGPALSPPNLRVHEIYDFRLAIPEGDWMFNMVQATHAYEPYVMSAFLERIKPESTVLDIGSNIGVFTIAAAKKARKVIAIEADADNAKAAVINLSLNGLTNAEVWPLAVGNYVGMLSYWKSPVSNQVMRQAGLTIDNAHEHAATMCMPLDMLPIGPVDVVKIDIEGSEYAALSAANNLFAMKPIFFAEFSPAFMRDVSGVDDAEFLQLFFSRGYSATILHRDMSREDVGQSRERLLTAWNAYRSRNITHLDLMFS